MIESLPFESTPEAGISRMIHFDDESGEMTVQTTQDVQGLMDDMARRRSHYDERTPFNKEMDHVGTIPVSIYYNMQEKFRDRTSGMVDEAAFKVACINWLSENPNFKARPWHRLT